MLLVVACWGLVAHVFGPTAPFGAQSDRFTKPPSHQLLSKLHGGCTCALQGPTLAVSHSRNGSDRMRLVVLQPQHAAATQRRRPVASPDREWEQWSLRWILRTKCKEDSVSQPCRIESVLTNLEIVISDMAMVLRPPTKPVHQPWPADGPDVVAHGRDPTCHPGPALPISRRPVRRLELQSQQSLGYLK
jgi:hypothetical protein